MRSISSIGFKNFRIFEDCEFELKPFTFITGANSSGKSTLFKSLLLLKHNTRQNDNLENLILSNKPYYLGTFETTKTVNNDDFFSFSFGFDVLPFPVTGYKFDLKIEYKFIKSGENSTLSKINISNKNKKIMEIDINDFETKVNEREIISLLTNFNDIISLLNDKVTGDDLFESYPDDDNELSIEGIKCDYSLFYPHKVEFQKPSFIYENNDGFNVEQKIDNTSINLLEENQDDENCLSDIAKAILNPYVILGKRKFNEIYRDDDIYERLTRDAISRVFGFNKSVLVPNDNIKAYIDFVINFSERIIPSVNETLISHLKNIEYLSSNRSRLSRYYQNTNVFSEIDEIIYKFSQYNNNDYQEEFIGFINKWLLKFEIGEKLIIDRVEGILSILYIESNGIKQNIADYGFGIIQLIPILIKIALIAYERNPLGTILLIEEPEANLHPKSQSLLAEMFVEASKKFKIQFIIETHSEYLIRQIQLLVAKGTVTPSEIVIYYINKKFGEGKNQIEKIDIDSDGSIAFEKFGEEFYKYVDNQQMHLLNINRDTFICDFSLLKSKSTAQKTEIESLQQKIDDFTKKLDISIYETIINQRFNLSKISTTTFKYLSSGQFLFHIIDTGSDYSPVIIQYGRAIENELKDVFSNVSNSQKWMLGNMQCLLEKFKSGTTTISNCNTTNLAKLQTELTNLFINPCDLKVELLEYIRNERNSAGHSGQTKTKLDAQNYINNVNKFIDKWIEEKK